jgi:SulP family sulfate permease
MPNGSSSAARTLDRVVPAIGSLRTYSFDTFRHDLVAGLSVAAVAVPQAISYALVAGLPPEYGLYTAVVMTAVGALFDSSKQLINGPTNAISIAFLSATAMMATPEQKIQAAVVMALFMGLIQLSIALLKLGDLTKFISHSVIVGFTLGAGALLPLDQLKNLLGLKAMGHPEDHFLVRFAQTVWYGHINWPTTAVGVGTIAFVLALRWFKRVAKLPLLPEFLIAVIVAAAGTAYLGLDKQGVAIVGQIPTKLPSFALPVFDWHTAQEMATGSLAIAVLGLLEAIAMAKSIAAVTGQKLDINQQALSEALANITGGFFQCMPGSGSLTRSAINQQAGAKTQWSGVVSAIAVATVVVLAGSYARFIPKAALAALLMVTSWRMVDWAALRYHARATRFDAVIIIVTALSAVLISVEFCVLIGVFMSFLLVVPRSANVLFTEFVLDEDGIIEEREEDDQRVCDRIQIYGLEGELYFGAVPSLEAHFDTIQSRCSDRTEFVLLRLKRVRNVDAVSIRALEKFLESMRARGVPVLLCGVRADLHTVFDRTGLHDRLEPHQLFLEQRVKHSSTQQAIRYAYHNLREPCSFCPRKEVVRLDRPVLFGRE